MGYRSNVVYAFVFEDALARDAFHAHVMEKNKQLEDVQQWDDDDFDPDDKHQFPCLYFRRDDIKWYDSFPEVQFVESLKQDAYERGGAWVMARLGEEDDDTEHDYDACDALNSKASYWPSEYVRIARTIETHY